MKRGVFRIMFMFGTVWAVSLSAYGESVDIAVWDVMGNSATATSVSVLSTASGVSASSITAHGVNVLRYNASQYEGVFVANHWSTAETPDFGKYFSWEVTDTVGYQLTALELSLSRGKYENNDDPNEPFGASKWDLYINDILVGTLDLDNYDGLGSTALPDEPIVWNVDLEATPQSPTYAFKLYGYSDEGGSDYAGLNQSWYGGKGVNVTLSGENISSTPEPITILSTAMGLTGLGWYLRKRKSAAADSQSA